MDERNEQWETNVSGDTMNTIKEEIITNCTTEYDPVYNNNNSANLEDMRNDLNNIKEEFITPHLENEDANQNDHPNENVNRNINDHVIENDCDCTEKSSQDISEAVSNILVMHLESITGE